MKVLFIDNFDSFTYESKIMLATFNRYTYEIDEIKPKENKQSSYTLNKAAEMMYLLSNLNNFSIFQN